MTWLIFYTYILPWLTTAGAVAWGIFEKVSTARVIDSYRSELKRNEARFSLYNQMQVKSLGEFFEHLSSMDLIVSKMGGDHKDGKISEKDYSNWLASAKSARKVYVSNKYVFPKSMHDKIDALMVNLNTAGPKTAHYIRRQGTLAFHWDGVDDIVYVEDHAEHARLSDKIEGYNFLENYVVIQKAGNEIKKDIIKKYEGLD